jgi:hypothetical protein
LIASSYDQEYRNCPEGNTPKVQLTQGDFGSLSGMNRENEVGAKTGKITPYKVFGWVPLALFFAAAGVTAFFGFLKGL